MCVYSRSVPISSLSVSLPPGSLAHMPAWSASLITQVRTLPASLGHECVCAHPSVTMEGLHVTDHPRPNPSGSECVRGLLLLLPTRVAALHTCSLGACTDLRACTSLHMSVYISRTDPTTGDITTPAPFNTCPSLHISVYSEPDGVPGSPLTPYCTVTDGTGQPRQPPPLCPDGHLTRVGPIH